MTEPKEMWAVDDAFKDLLEAIYKVRAVTRDRIVDLCFRRDSLQKEFEDRAIDVIKGKAEWTDSAMRKAIGALTTIAGPEARWGGRRAPPLLRQYAMNALAEIERAQGGTVP